MLKSSSKEVSCEMMSRTSVRSSRWVTTSALTDGSAHCAVTRPSATVTSTTPSMASRASDSGTDPTATSMVAIPPALSRSPESVSTAVSVP
nr:hypothetical protein [Halapricum sp. CBA1109]